MKVVISLAPIKSGSKTRGVGVYTKRLIEALQSEYPEDKYILTSQSYYHSDADLVHLPFFDPFFLTLPSRYPIPTIATIHDLTPIKFREHFPRGFKGNLKWLIQKGRARRLSHIITDSDCSKTDIEQILKVDSARVSRVYLGPSLVPAKSDKGYVKEVSEKLKLPRRFALYVGDINWNKNVPGLIREFKEAAVPGLELVLVGKALTGTLVPELKEIHSAIADSGVSESIHLYGYLPKDELSALFKLSEFYIQPSFYEGFGLSVLDAMAHGCPVLSSVGGSLPEIGGEAVLYFDPNEKGALAQGIGKMENSSALREKYRKLGVAQAKQFTWIQAARETHAVYEKILAKS